MSAGVLKRFRVRVVGPQFVRENGGDAEKCDGFVDEVDDEIVISYEGNIERTIRAAVAAGALAASMMAPLPEVRAGPPIVDDPTVIADVTPIKMNGVAAPIIKLSPPSSAP